MTSGGNWKEMFLAAEEGDLELVRYHLRMGVDPNYQHPEFLTGALLESIRQGHLEVAELLLENGANPEITRYDSTETPMAIAVAQRNIAAINLLNVYLPEDLRNDQVEIQADLEDSPAFLSKIITFIKRLRSFKE